MSVCGYNISSSIAAAVFVFTAATGDSFVLVPLQSVKDEGEAAKPWLMVTGRCTATARPLSCDLRGTGQLL